jgi:hypothetical protein
MNTKRTYRIEIEVLTPEGDEDYLPTDEWVTEEIGEWFDDHSAANMRPLAARCGHTDVRSKLAMNPRRSEEGTP